MRSSPSEGRGGEKGEGYLFAVKSALCKMAALAVFAAAMAPCSPNPNSQFDATCANDLECMGWYMTDICDDGRDSAFGFFGAAAGGKKWGPYVTSGLGVYTTGVMKCAKGETICLGAAAGELSWGVGIEGGKSCLNCCGQCNGMSYMFKLACDPGPNIYGRAQGPG